MHGGKVLHTKLVWKSSLNENTWDTEVWVISSKPTDRNVNFVELVYSRVCVMVQMHLWFP
jgi:hypothetical protein